MKYSEGFRNSLLRKVLPPENRSVYGVARETGMLSPTVTRARFRAGSLASKMVRSASIERESSLRPLSWEQLEN
jgi:hypothetical protein